MMFELRVTGLDEVERLAGWATCIVSVFVGVLPNYGPRHLVLRFDDILRPTPGLLLPEYEHLVQLLDFTRDLDASSKVLVHCNRGINRSTAMAVAILLQHGMNCQDAYRKVASLRPGLAPNRLMIKHIDRHFGLNGQLSRRVMS